MEKKTRKMKTRKGYAICGWYQWGSEDLGFVSIWGLNKDGSVHGLGTIKQEQLDASIPFDCPLA